MHEENYRHFFFHISILLASFMDLIYLLFLVIGHVDFFGNLTGDSIAFIYPDLKHVLLGTFSKGTVYIYWNRKLVASVTAKRKLERL